MNICLLLIAALAAFASPSVSRFTKPDLSHVQTPRLNGHGEAVPTAVDWREKSVVTPVRNQGEIRSSLELGFLDALESWYAIQHGDHLETASDAQLFACCGSHGHVLDDLYQCVLNIGGLCSNRTYIPKAGVCNTGSCTSIFTFKHEGHVLRGSERALEVAVAGQPILVAVDASDADFRDYQGGVLSDARCSRERLDHAMLAVGYATSSQGVQYWILKNSWGTAWGEQGYLWLAKDRNNMCGVASDATFPFGE